MSILRANPRSIPLPFRFGAVVGFDMFPGEFVMLVARTYHVSYGVRSWVGISLFETDDYGSGNWRRGETVTINPYDTGVNVVDDGPDV